MFAYMLGRKRLVLQFRNFLIIVLMFVFESLVLITNVCVRSFRQRVNQNNKGNVFLADGKHTFFIPVDEGFKVVLILNNT
jgi:hypothetical protein